MSRARFRSALATIVAAALSVTLLAPPAHATPSANSAAAVTVPPWVECRDGFECAVVPVPWTTTIRRASRSAWR